MPGIAPALEVKVSNLFKIVLAVFLTAPTCTDGGNKFSTLAICLKALTASSSMLKILSLYKVLNSPPNVFKRSLTKSGLISLTSRPVALDDSLLARV